MTTEIQNGYRMITTFFDSRAAAEKAKADVLQLGIPVDQVSIVEGQSAHTSTASGIHDKGFWESLKEMILPDEDRQAYAEGLRRGGFLVSVKTDAALYDHVLSVLDADGAVDLQDRETQWRSEGWTSHHRGTETSGLFRTTPVERTSSSALGVTGQENTDETLPVAEERLQVGKRDTNHGRVRLRSYVVETPVNESIQLRSENVDVDRRSVDRAANATDQLFEERVIEAEEHEEIPVVSKEARVVEEVSLRKTVAERTHEVNDTVRRTDVKVEDERGNAVGAAGSTGRRFTSSEILAHMDVIASDGKKIGTVDHLDTGNQIKLAKNTSPDGQHHFISLDEVDHVDERVHLKTPSQTIQSSW